MPDEPETKPRTKAVEDFDFIRKRREELQKEREEAQNPPGQTLTESNQIGNCHLCLQDKIPCNGMCYGC